MTAPGHGWVLPLGTASGAGCEVLVDDTTEGWSHTGLRVVTLAAGRPHTWRADGWECVAVPLSGSCRLEVTEPDGTTTTVTLAGRPDVFAGPSDVAYVPPGCGIVATTDDEHARLALCLARTDEEGLGVRHVPAQEVPVELRGAGTCSREVRNFATPDQLDAHRIIACEVITPGGNWSSYPPHKHDEERPGVETELEEIYYFETRTEPGSPAPEVADPVGYQRVYGTADRPIDVLAEVRSGDVVLVPHGWHGPATAPPGYDLYYLNVMAGPGPELAWLICDDPSHGWVRATWAGQEVDPRLPLGGGRA